jgi:ferredoxin
MPVKKKMVDIATDSKKCTGCLMCALRCSLRYTGAFNPLKARIRINKTNGNNEISFAEECTKCGLCAQYCIYGALTAKEGD